MCVIIAKPSGTQLAKKTLAACYRQNSDGAGFAFPDNGKVRIFKGYFNFEDFWKDVRDIQKKRPMLLHCRITTHGVTDPTNCHPFYLSDNVAFAHNGMIPDLERETVRSDTRILVEDVLQPLIERWPKMLDHPGALHMLDRLSGSSKFGFLTGDGNLLCLNKKDWDFHKGALFSNTSWKRRLSSYSRAYNTGGYYGFVGSYTTLPEVRSELSKRNLTTHTRHTLSVLGWTEIDSIIENLLYTFHVDTWDTELGPKILSFARRSISKSVTKATEFWRDRDKKVVPKEKKKALKSDIRSRALPHNVPCGLLNLRDYREPIFVEGVKAEKAENVQLDEDRAAMQSLKWIEDRGAETHKYRMTRWSAQFAPGKHLELNSEGYWFFSTPWKPKDYIFVSHDQIDLRVNEQSPEKVVTKEEKAEQEKDDKEIVGVYFFDMKVCAPCFWEWEWVQDNKDSSQDLMSVLQWDDVSVVTKRQAATLPTLICEDCHGTFEDAEPRKV